MRCSCASLPAMLVGWGECEASPLVSIAAFVCPMSHGACRPVSASVLGQQIDGPADIARMAAAVELDSMDLLQAAHTWSGIEMALWDLLGKVRREPVWKLLGYARAEKKLPYASQLFATRPQETLELAVKARSDGYRAAKFGWGPIGRGSAREDADQFNAAREGLGPDGTLLIDVGPDLGRRRRNAHQPGSGRSKMSARSGWRSLSRPALYAAYGALAARSPKVKLAGGEGAHNFHMASNLIDYGGIGFVQIDCGRIGGIGPAKRVAEHAVAKGVTYVNHTFTSHLALSASIQPYAGLADHRICEYPVTPKPVAWEMTRNHLTRDENGEIVAPDAPGLGIEISDEAIRKYGVDVELKVRGETIFRSRAPS